MNIELKIVAGLKTFAPLEFAELDTRQLEQVQERAFRLSYPERSLFIKWIPWDDERGANEIHANREILASADAPAPRLLFVVETGEAALAGWEWLEGSDLRQQHRQLLPAAFAQLGAFHAAQRHQREVCSPVTRRAFDSIPELLRAEAGFLCSFYDPASQARCQEIFSRLEAGYPTFIHGDMHPGNIRLAPGGLKFVDWGYAMNSLNLFDLGYVQSIRLDPQDPPWWIIPPGEAQTVLPTYFAACGLGETDYRPIHQAVMLWNELWSHYNGLKNNLLVEAAVSRKNITRLLGEKTEGQE